MAEVRSTFLCVGGLFTPVMPVAPDGSIREVDGLHYFAPEQVARETGLSLAAINEAYEVFLQEVGDGIHGTEAARRANDMLRGQFSHIRSDALFEQFKLICRQLGLNPFAGMVRAHVAWDDEQAADRLEVRPTVKGLYAIIHQTCELVNTVGPQFMSATGQWLDAWPAEEPPLAVRFGVLRAGMSEPFIRTCASAEAAEYEALALAFADKLQGLSMEQLGEAPRRQVTGLPLEVSAVAPDDLPQTARQFQLRLIAHGLQDPIARNRFSELMRRRFPALFSSNITDFYAKALAELREHPSQYGAAPQGETNV